MFCIRCGAHVTNHAKFCQGCGEEIYQGERIPDQRVSSFQSRSLAIWNPNAAVNWSLLFSPVFGAYVQMRNWQILENHEKAAEAKGWMVFSMLVIIGCFIASSTKKFPPALDSLPLVYLFVWYFASGKEQGTYIKERYGSGYPKRPWLKLIVVAFIAEAIFVVTTFFLAVAALSFIKVTDSPDQAVSTSAPSPAPRVEPTRSNPFGGQNTTGPAQPTVDAYLIEAESRASQLWDSVPELDSWIKIVDQSSNGLRHGKVELASSTPKVLRGREYFQFNLMEVSENASKLVESYYVPRYSGEILVGLKTIVSLEKRRIEMRTSLIQELDDQLNNSPIAHVVYNGGGSAIFYKDGSVASLPQGQPLPPDAHRFRENEKLLATLRESSVRGSER